MSEVTWGIPVVLDLFFAGLGAGSFCFGAMTSRREGKGWESCSRMSLFLAPVALVIGMAMLIADLGYKSRFWMTVSVFNPYSPMSIGAWLFSLFLIVSVAFALYWIPTPIRKRLPGIGALSLWERTDIRGRIGWVGTLLALGVSVYTGVLLSVTGTPLWRGFSLPLFFFLSALATGFSGGGMLAILFVEKKDADAMKGPLQFVKRSYRVILPCLLLVALGYGATRILSPASKPAAIHLMTGWSGLIWWVGAIGIGMVVPWALVMRRQAIEVNRAWPLFASALVGGFLLRFVLVFAGQGAL